MFVYVFMFFLNYFYVNMLSILCQYAVYLNTVSRSLYIYILHEEKDRYNEIQGERIVIDYSKKEILDLKSP